MCGVSLRWIMGGSEQSALPLITHSHASLRDRPVDTSPSALINSYTFITATVCVPDGTADV